MIRRDAGANWLLITQSAHAAVAARLALHVGGRAFAPIVARRQSVVAAVAGHDDGWRAHDGEPTLDDRGRPLDVFDAPHAIALPAWAASTAAITAADGPWAGLLVSLHALSLSIRAAGPPGPGHATFALTTPHATFAVNQFQHREIERQEILRRSIGLPTDIPLMHGLAEPGASDADDQLAYDFRLLQALDLVSLSLCCTHVPAARTGDVLPLAGGRAKQLTIARDAGGVLRVRPWPFDVARIEVTVPARRLPAVPFAEVTAFRAAYAAAPEERLSFSLRA